MLRLLSISATNGNGRKAYKTASTKVPVTCATNIPNSARTVKLSMKPAAKLSSGGSAAGTGCGRGAKTSLMISPGPQHDPEKLPTFGQDHATE